MNSWTESHTKHDLYNSYVYVENNSSTYEYYT